MLYPMIFIVPSLVLLIYFLFYRTGIKNISKVAIKGKAISVEIADTEVKRMKGLMFKESLGNNSGMLFIFPNLAKHSFWMANTKISLDIIWIGEDLKIVYISPNTPPCTQTGTLQAYCQSYAPSIPAKYVLEVNGGWCEKNTVMVGDEMSLKYD